MRVLLSVATVAAVAVMLATASPGRAQDALASLQGRWVVTGAEHNGKPMDSIKGGVMTIAGSAFEVRTATGNLLKGSLTADTSKRPFELDMLHADGERWEAIFSVEGDVLKLNYVEAGGKDPRPKTFTTSATTEESIVTLQRQNR